jgi:hypothetical protein
MTDLLYVVSVHEIAWGIILVAVSLIMHAFGMIFITRFSTWFDARFDAQATFVGGITGLILASWMLIAVHFSEVLVWAGFFQWKHCFANFSTAVFYALMEYTTVGSDFSLPVDWRLLGGMIATAGLLGFAWSTGVLLTLAQHFQTSEIKRQKARHKARQKARS